MANLKSTAKDALRILIVGGVAGGASCAARARRLAEQAEIIILERGAYVSFANCGLPYFIGDIITEERKLLLVTPALFENRFNIRVRTECNVTAVDLAQQQIEVADLKTSRKYIERYDALVLAPGAVPIRPPLPGIDLPGIFSLRTIPDSLEIRDWIAKKGSRRAVIVGGGFVGLEMAENLTKRGIATTIIEMQEHLMPNLDAEMAAPVHDHLTAHGVSLNLGDAVSGFEQPGEGQLIVKTKSGKAFAADLVILALGVRPDTSLAKPAGLEIGGRGGIRVDGQMRTSDPHVWAVGDAVETLDYVTGEWTTVPLAGIANRQGRVAAAAILGRAAQFRGVQATAICGVFGLTIAATGLTEKTLARLKAAGRPINYQKVYLHPNQHASYYPGASRISLKLIFSADDGRILGTQAVGQDGVDKRIDVISLAIQKHATVFDLEEAELCYAPQYGAAKDPLDLAGMIAANMLRGDAPVAHWEDVAGADILLLDVRSRPEFDSGYVNGAQHIPIDELRSRLNELPPGREIWAYCATGQRSHVATCMLRSSGFNARNLSGGIQTYNDMAKVKRV